jgi:hypothetical protein
LGRAGLENVDGESDERKGWIAFLLSLAMPGAGQLWLRDLSGVVWLLLAALLIMVWGLVAENVGYHSAPGHFFSFLFLGMLSAEHARRLATRRQRL